LPGKRVDAMRENPAASKQRLLATLSSAIHAWAGSPGQRAEESATAARMAARPTPRPRSSRSMARDTSLCEPRCSSRITPIAEPDSSTIM
jgi:hypothetical protein